MHKKTLFLGFSAEILLLCAEILPFLGSVQKHYYPGTRGGLDSRAGPFLGYVQIYSFLEKYSPLLWGQNYAVELSTLWNYDCHANQNHIKLLWTMKFLPSSLCINTRGAFFPRQTCTRPSGGRRRERSVLTCYEVLTPIISNHESWSRRLKLWWWWRS